MKFINLDQRTQAWKTWRQQGITATDSVVILGMSPYKTPWRLWSEKTGRSEPPDLSHNPNVQRGIALEDTARRLFENKNSILCPPACAESDEEPIFRASFDGLTANHLPVEFKCPSEKILEEVKAQGLSSPTVRMYSVQVQHQMLVAGAPKGYLVFLDGEDLIEFEIQRDDSLIELILEKGKAFYEAIQKDIPPEKDPERDFFIPDEKIRAQWIEAANDFIALEQEIKKLEKRVKEFKAAQVSARTKIEELMGDNLSADFGGIAVTRSHVKGRVDYNKYFELTGAPDPDLLAQCTGSASIRTTIRLRETQQPKNYEDAALSQSIKDLSESVTPNLYF